MELKGFAFDLDGVLTDTAHYHFKAWHELAEKLGISIDLVFNEQLKGVSRMDSLELILTHGQQQGRYSVAEKEQLAAEKNKLYLTLIEEMTPADILPGILVFLNEIKARKIPMALASASKNGPLILTKLGLTNYFKAIVDPVCLKKGKPDPEIFIRAAELLALRPEECVGVEDAQAGIQGINAAQMFSVGIGDEKNLVGADLLFKTTTELNLAAVEKQFLAAK